MEDALTDGFLSTDGKYTSLLKAHFNQSAGIGNMLFTPSATAALELSVQLLGLMPGDEVILPSYNFPSAANAVIKYGGVPVLCDVDPGTKNISLEDAASRISKKTRAILPTHYGGVSCDMDRLMELAQSYDLAVIEDAAQAVHSAYHGVPLGSIGNFGAYSFHHTKNFSCGEGGAFLCKDPSRMDLAEMLRDNGTDKAQFQKQKVSSYSWQCAGSNYMMSAACSSLLYAQLLEHKRITAKRRAVSDHYNGLLSGEAEKLSGGIKPMKIPRYSTPNYHIYYVDCRDYEMREAVRKGMLEDGIDVRTHFVPLHLSGYGRALGYEAHDFPGSLSAYETILRLPIHTEMTESDCEAVIRSLLKRAGVA